MKRLFLTATLAAFGLGLTAPAQAAPAHSTIQTLPSVWQGDVEKRKKKRIKGGSGCDDAHDILEHPECR